MPLIWQSRFCRPVIHRVRPSNSGGKYFAAGTQLVWEIDPDAHTIAVYTDPSNQIILIAADTLTGGTVLPGFTLQLAELFNDPQLNPRV